MQNRLRPALGSALVCALLLLGVAPVASGKRLSVVTTTPDLAHLARRVGGANVTVTALIGAEHDPHYAQARPDFIVKLSRADVFVETGLDLEVGWSPILIRQSRNPRIFKNGPGYCDASRNIRVLEVPSSGADRSKGDMHAFGNPHYMLDPVNAGIAARNIRDTLMRVDPARKAQYMKNYSTLMRQLRAMTISEYRKFRPFRGMKVAVHHREFVYLAKRFKFDIAVSLEEKPGVPPSAAYLRKVVATMKKNKVRVILLAPWNNARYAQSVARRAGARVLVMPVSVGSRPGQNTYEAIIRTMLSKLRTYGGKR